MESDREHSASWHGDAFLFGALCFLGLLFHFSATCETSTGQVVCTLTWWGRSVSSMLRRIGPFYPDKTVFVVYVEAIASPWLPKMS